MTKSIPVRRRTAARRLRHAALAVLAVIAGMGAGMAGERDLEGAGAFHHIMEACVASAGDVDKFLGALEARERAMISQGADREEGAAGESLGRATAAMFCAGMLNLNGKPDAASRMLDTAIRELRRSDNPAAKFLLPQYQLYAAQFALNQGDLRRAQSLAEDTLEQIADDRALALKFFRKQMGEALDEHDGGADFKPEDAEKEFQAKMDGGLAMYEASAHGVLATIYERPPLNWTKAEAHAALAEALAAKLPAGYGFWMLPGIQAGHAYALEGLHRDDEALVLVRKAIAGLKALPGGLSASGEDAAMLDIIQNLSVRVAGNAGYLYDTYAVALLAVYDKHPTPELAEELFHVVQMLHESKDGDISQALVAKLETGSDALAALLRKRESALQSMQNAFTDAHAIKALFEHPDEGVFGGSSQDIYEIDREIAQKYPQYGKFLNPQSVDLAAARAALRPGEHIVLYFSSFDVLNALVVSKDAAPVVMRSLAYVDGVTKLVTQLRQSLAAPAHGDTAPFAAAAAQTLYAMVFARPAAVLPRGDQILIVPEGALASVPFEVLLQGAPADLGDRGLAAAPWLGNAYRFATLPSVTALTALRGFAPYSKGTRPFLGLGDPLLPDEGGRDIRNIPPGEPLGHLKGAQTELAQSAALLQSGPDSLYVAARFTKQQIEDLNAGGVMRNTRIIQIASHTTWIKHEPARPPADNAAADADPQYEPAIVLTPPAASRPPGDGFLTLGDIAGLSLDADWVILSACDTAADDGTPNALPLSGFARAFFYAKARALLVSHWAVNDTAASLLMPEIFKSYGRLHARSAALAEAEARVRAMPGFGHPHFWAPFVIVGEPDGPPAGP